ncbi:MAG TPA: magnesium transporter [Actinomycetota bacterium]
MAPPRALARRAKRLLGYWRSETRTIRQGLVALALSTAAGFVAGLTLAHLTGTLAEFPGLYILIPAAVGMRGTIFGSMGARLGTADAAGLLTIDLRPGGVLRRNVVVAILTTSSSALWIAVLARLAAVAFGEPSISFGQLVIVAVVGGALGSAVILTVTVALAAASTRLGWDLDSVSTPMVTALGDVATLPSMFLATLLLGHGAITAAIAALCFAVALTLAVVSYRARDPSVRKIVREMTATIALAPILDVLAGQLQQARVEQLFAVPVVMAIIPPFVSQAGALGGIFSSRITSKMQLGVITPRGRPETPAIVDATIVVALSLVVFTLIGSVGWVLGTVTDLPGVPSAATIIGATLLSGAIVTPITIAAGYYLAVVTYRFGLDPDNQGVPFITSAMDLAGVAVVLFVMTSSGVLPHG